METENLVRRCKNNDRDALNELLSGYENYLYRLCYSFTFDKEETLDLIQEVYLKIIRSLHAFDEQRPLSPWIKKIAVNTCLNYLRSKHKHDHLSLNYSVDGEDGEQLINTLASPEHTENMVVYRDRFDLIMEAIHQLPPNHRIPLTLRTMDEMSYEEIAAALGQPLGTVKNSVFRARRLLKKRLQGIDFWEVAVR